MTEKRWRVQRGALFQLYFLFVSFGSNTFDAIYLSVFSLFACRVLSGLANTLLLRECHPRMGDLPHTSFFSEGSGQAGWVSIRRAKREIATAKIASQ
jgi:hypothetical protein